MRIMKNGLGFGLGLIDEKCVDIFKTLLNYRPNSTIIIVKHSIFTSISAISVN